MATPKDANEPVPCPQCASPGRLRGVGTVAHQPEDFKLTYGCHNCQHEWSVVKPAQWLTRLGETDDG